jgi:hypothetical protein
MKEALEKLKTLKGMLLLNSSGNLYILTDYTYVEDKLVESGFVIKKSKKVSYIDSITVSATSGKSKVDYDANPGRINWAINLLITDRNRYLKLQRDLNSMGYAIRKK